MPTPVSSVHPHPVTVPMTDVTVKDRHLLGVIILVAFSMLTCLIGLRTGPALGDREAFHALSARDAIENRRWLIPMPGEEQRVRQAPLGFWAVAAASVVFQPADEKPVNTFTARLPSALAAIVNVLAIYWLGSMLYGHRAGLVGGFIAAACAATLFFARSAQADQLLAMFTTLAFAFFWRGTFHAQPSRIYLAAFYVCFALAMMTKAPLPLVTIGLGLAVFWFVALPLIEANERGPLPRSTTRRWSEAMGRRARGLRHLWLLPGLAVFVALAGAWPLYVYFQVPNALELWRHEFVNRYAGTMSDKTWSIWYYIPFIFVFTFPFLASIPEAVASPFLPRYAGVRRGLGYVFTWAAVTTIFLSTASHKQPHYLLSAIPAYCLLLAPVVDRVFFGTLFASKRVVDKLCLGLPLIIGGVWAAGTWYGQKQFPDLGRTIPIALGAAALLWMAASLAFYVCFRRSAFGLLLLSIPVMLALSSSAIARLSTNRDAEGLSKALFERTFNADADMYWVDGRPDDAVEFATGLRLQRLMAVNETADIPKDGASDTPEITPEIVERIVGRIGEPKPANFIISKRNYDQLVTARSFPHRIALEVPGPGAEKSFIVFAQAAGP